MMISVSNNK